MMGIWGYVLVTPNSRMINPLLQRPLKMRYTLRTTPKPHLLAKIIPSFPTDPTLPAWNPYFERNAVADLESIHLRSDGAYDAGGFMAEGERRAGA